MGACLQDTEEVVIVKKPDDSYEVLLREISMRFLPVRAGPCWIGADARQLDTIVVESHNPAFKLEESPQHAIEIRYDFWISETEVSNAQYVAFLRHSCRDTFYVGGLPPDLPVVDVSWREAVAFCKWLSSEIQGFLFRLPHEVEWEYAAKGNSKRKYPWEGNSITDSLANFGNLHGGLLSVYSLPRGKSVWGALNMAGNAYEWCLNAPYSYPTNPLQLRPELDMDANSCEQRAVRGGAFLNNAFECRTTARHFLTCESKNRHVGFRVLMVPLGEN